MAKTNKVSKEKLSASKEKGAKEPRPIAPWDGSSFESQAKDAGAEHTQSEYHESFYEKRGNHKAEAIRPNRAFTISKQTEQMETSTTYTSNFLPMTDNKNRIKPFRPNENGIHYELTNTTSMQTTHDRTFTSDSFPPERSRRRTEGNDQNKMTTMQEDFTMKKVKDPAKPFRPPVGLSDTLKSVNPNAIDDIMMSTNDCDFVMTNIKEIEMAKNCKPILKYEKPMEPMETTTTAQSQFTWRIQAPAKSCKPISNGI